MKLLMSFSPKNLTLMVKISQMILDLKLIMQKKSVRYITARACALEILKLFLAVAARQCFFLLFVWFPAFVYLYLWLIFFVVACSGVERKTKFVRFADLVNSEVTNAQEGGKKKSRNGETWAANAFDEWRRCHGLSIVKSIADLSEEPNLHAFVQVHSVGSEAGWITLSSDFVSSLYI
jgi:type IV secretory pathway VirB3-like protein